MKKNIVRRILSKAAAATMFVALSSMIILGWIGTGIITIFGGLRNPKLVMQSLS